MSRFRVEVAPDRKAGDWKVTAAGAEVSRHASQRLAIAAAVAYCRTKVGEGARLPLKIKRRDGTIRDERTYPRSSDPRRSRG